MGTRVLEDIKTIDEKQGEEDQKEEEGEVDEEFVAPEEGLTTAELAIQHQDVDQNCQKEYD